MSGRVRSAGRRVLAQPAAPRRPHSPPGYVVRVPPPRGSCGSPGPQAARPRPGHPLGPGRERPGRVGQGGAAPRPGRRRRRRRTRRRSRAPPAGRPGPGRRSPPPACPTSRPVAATALTTLPRSDCQSNVPSPVTTRSAASTRARRPTASSDRPRARHPPRRRAAAGRSRGPRRRRRRRLPAPGMRGTPAASQAAAAKSPSACSSRCACSGVAPFCSAKPALAPWNPSSGTSTSLATTSSTSAQASRSAGQPGQLAGVACRAAPRRRRRAGRRGRTRAGGTGSASSAAEQPGSRRRWCPSRPRPTTMRRAPAARCGQQQLADPGASSSRRGRALRRHQVQPAGLRGLDLGGGRAVRCRREQHLRRRRLAQRPGHGHRSQPLPPRAAARTSTKPGPPSESGHSSRSSSGACRAQPSAIARAACRRRQGAGEGVGGDEHAHATSLTLSPARRIASPLRRPTGCGRGRSPSITGRSLADHLPTIREEATWTAPCGPACGSCAASASPAKFGLVTLLLLLPLTIGVGSGYAESTGLLQCRPGASRPGSGSPPPGPARRPARAGPGRGGARYRAAAAPDRRGRCRRRRWPAWPTTRRACAGSAGPWRQTRQGCGRPSPPRPCPQRRRAARGGAPRRCLARAQEVADASGPGHRPRSSTRHYVVDQAGPHAPRLLARAASAAGGRSQQARRRRGGRGSWSRTARGPRASAGTRRPAPATSSATSGVRLGGEAGAVRAAVTQYAGRRDVGARVTPLGSGSLAAASAGARGAELRPTARPAPHPAAGRAGGQPRPAPAAGRSASLLVLGYLLVARVPGHRARTSAPCWRTSARSPTASSRRRPAAAGSDEFARMSRAVTDHPRPADRTARRRCGTRPRTTS